MIILLDNPFYEQPEQAALRKSDESRLQGKLDWLKSAIASVFSGDLVPETIPNRQ